MSKLPPSIFHSVRAISRLAIHTLVKRTSSPERDVLRTGLILSCLSSTASSWGRYLPVRQPARSREESDQVSRYLQSRERVDLLETSCKMVSIGINLKQLFEACIQILRSMDKMMAPQETLVVQSGKTDRASHGLSISSSRSI